MRRKAKAEANVALLNAHNGYQKLLREGYRFELAKRQNNDILPMHMWSDWMQWRQRLKEIDKEIERFYR